jgi:hypothetical protein
VPATATESLAPLADQLGQFGQNALKKIVQTLHLTILDHDGHARTLAAFLGNPRHRAILERELSADDWALLTLLPVQVRAFPLRVLVVALRERKVALEAIFETIHRLFALGCFVPSVGLSQMPPGASRLGIEPNALRTSTLQAWFDLVPGVGQWAQERHPAALHLPVVQAPPRIAEPRSSEFQRAMLILLSEATHKPIRLTTIGYPYKTEQTRLVKALARGAAEPTGAKRRAETPAAPPVLWFALAALLGTGLLQEDDTGNLAPAPDASAFHAASPADRARMLVAGWCRGPFDDFRRIPTLTGYAWNSGEDAAIPWIVGDAYGTGPDPNRLAEARMLVFAALHLTGARDPEAWHRIDDLARLIYTDDREFLFPRYDTYELVSPPAKRWPGQPDVRPAYYGVYRANEIPGAGTTLYRDDDWIEVEGAFVRQVLAESLLWLGIVEVGPDAQHPDRYRLSPLGQHLITGKPLPTTATSDGAPAVVQPNYEVVVLDAMANAALVARLDEVAERRGLDRAATYRLTQDTLVRGMDRGRTGQQIVELLEAANGGPLPQNVIYTLREWIRLYEQLSLRETATLLEANDAHQLDRWLADRHLASLLGRRLGPTSVLVPAQNSAKVARQINQASPGLHVVDYAQPRGKVLRVRGSDLIEGDSTLLDPYLRYRLAAFAVDEHRSGKTAAYRITAGSVGAAARDGWKGDDLAAILTDLAESPLPDEFRIRLLGWAGAVPPLRFEPLVAVCLSSKAVDWETLRKIPVIDALVRFLPTPELALVAPADLPTLASELAERGVSLQETTLTEKDLPAHPSFAEVETVLAQAARDPYGAIYALRELGRASRASTGSRR